MFKSLKKSKNPAKKNDFKEDGQQTEEGKEYKNIKSDESGTSKN
jgi:hypothetical protein